MFTTVCRRTLLGLAGAAVLSLAGAASASAAALVVGSYPSNPPFEYKTSSGTFEGFEVDIVNEVAKRLGMTVEISDLGFQALFAATASKRIDVAISSITITKERMGSQSFTQPYYDSDMGIATRKEVEISKIEDLNGKIVGVLAGSTGDKWSRENKDKLGISEIKSYNAQQDMLMDLSAGRADAAVSDVPGMEYSFLKMKDLAVKVRIKTGEQYGLMMTKDHPLLEKANEALTAMKKDGTLAEIHKKWFGSEPAEGSASAVAMPMPKP
ncbi:amino acid ABC transporter substrate-binding protein [Neorhizobium sp. SOG26]|uniref:ABC transporter substrate-binding protein n=1 Tax=Neorhizobium sp. SOG26 TaxID=2060726 RepID=UPI000E56C9EC|nr:ABC transporter substrate-binding protein [Neorhizobium sp. SOG26]AXV16775.1 amino acid ABC transporter substrate-binding protein [Neorhizobium sp. SOG26]